MTADMGVAPDACATIGVSSERGSVVVAQEDPLDLLSWTFIPIGDARRLNNQRKGYLLYRRRDAAGGG